MRILIDSRLLLEEFLHPSENIESAWSLLKQKQYVQGYLTRFGVDSIRSEVSRLKGSTVADKVICEIEAVLTICDLSSRVSARASLLWQMDDQLAIEVACAIEQNLNAILTQSPQDFIRSGLKNLSIQDLLDEQSSQNFSGYLTPLLLEGRISDLVELERLFAKPVNLSNWLMKVFDTNWQPVEELLIERFAFRRSVNSVCRGKLLTFHPNTQIALVVGVFSDSTAEVDVTVEIYSGKGESCLPQGFCLEVVDENGYTVNHVSPPSKESSLQIRFGGVRGENFDLKMTSSEVSVTEKFVI